MTSISDPAEWQVMMSHVPAVFPKRIINAGLSIGGTEREDVLKSPKSPRWDFRSKLDQFVEIWRNMNKFRLWKM